jgi:hypothetical protein
MLPYFHARLCKLLGMFPLGKRVQVQQPRALPIQVTFYLTMTMWPTTWRIFQVWVRQVVEGLSSQRRIFLPQLHPEAVRYRRRLLRARR